MSQSNCHFTWLKQQETLVSLAESLLKDATYYDCQLCAEGQRFNVHRVILSCNSPIFSNLLQEHTADIPVITVDGISAVELQALIEFMYTGVASLSPRYLKNFFQVAKSLNLAGLYYYDSAQIDSFINEDNNDPTQAKLQDNYEAISQKILNYLDHPEPGVTPDVKSLTALKTNEDCIFLDESSESVNIASDNDIIYKEYGEFTKTSEGQGQEEDDGMDTMESQVVENENSPEINEIDIEEEKPIFFDKVPNVFMKNAVDTISTDVSGVFSLSNLNNLEKKDEDKFDTENIIEETDGDKNYVFVRVDIDTFNKLKQRTSTEGKEIVSKNEVSYVTKKCRKVTDSGKNFVLKKSKTQTVKKIEVDDDDNTKYTCAKCGNKYSHRRTLMHHIHWICEQPPTYSCTLCPYKGKRKFQLKSHMKHIHLLKMS